MASTNNVFYSSFLGAGFDYDFSQNFAGNGVAVKNDDGTEDITALGGNLSITEVRIQKLYASPKSVEIGKTYGEEWLIKGVIIAALDFGGLDYTSEEVNTITMKLMYKNAAMFKLERQEEPEAVGDFPLGDGGTGIA